MRVRILKREQAIDLGYSGDRRKRRREHRKSVKRIIGAGTLFNGIAAPGSTGHSVAQWHLAQARGL